MLYQLIFYRFQVMQDCWSTNPDNRPSFSELVSILDGILTPLAGYMDFAQLPVYMSLKSSTTKNSKSEDNNAAGVRQDVTPGTNSDNDNYA